MSRRLLFVLPLVIAGVAWSKPPDKPGPVTTSTPAPSPKSSVDFAPIDAKIGAGDWKSAMDDLEVVLADPTKTGAEAAAWDRMGRALAAGGLPYASLAAWLKGASSQTGKEAKVSPMGRVASTESAKPSTPRGGKAPKKAPAKKASAKTSAKKTEVK